ncbi:MAG: ATP-NAD kinase [Euryarchaeota archaeon]|nr:ATP-NAD kinase [Euryarchaeota archaeon]
MKIGFIVNPVAGMGGSVGLKGTDNLYEVALRLGAREVSPNRAVEFLKKSKDFLMGHEIITCGGKMGETELLESGYSNFSVIYKTSGKTSRIDTVECAKRMIDASIIIFVGGDGTARDVMDSVDMKVPVLGIPSGVKMYSAVFASSIDSAKELIRAFIDGNTSLEEREVLDIDEDKYRRNEFSTRLYGYLKVPVFGRFLQNSKAEIYSTDDEEDKQGIAEFFIDNMENDALYLLGPGTTVKKICSLLGKECTLLGFDALYGNEIIARDLNSRSIEELIKKYNKFYIVLSPIGNQGFIIGRGNLQLTPDILKNVKKENIIILATPQKLSNLDRFLIDAGDENVSRMLSGYYRVITGYGRIRMFPAEYGY